MFTGIVECVGQIAGINRTAGIWTLSIDCPGLSGMNTGDSLAVSGICLTVTEHRPNTVTVQASRETRRVTTLGNWRPGRPVNLERALAFGGRLGGHLVSGHVDGVGRVLKSVRTAGSVSLTVVLPTGDMPPVVDRGSVTIDGVSLTVVRARGRTFTVNIIPETLARTTLSDLRAGAQVNVEGDLLARYAAGKTTRDGDRR